MDTPNPSSMFHRYLQVPEYFVKYGAVRYIVYPFRSETMLIIMVLIVTDTPIRFVAPLTRRRNRKVVDTE